MAPKNVPKRKTISKREILEAALSVYSQRLQKINEQITLIKKALSGAKDGRAQQNTAMSQPRKRRKMSVAGRRKISEAQKRRWAEYKENQQTQPVASKKKITMIRRRHHKKRSKAA